MNFETVHAILEFFETISNNLMLTSFNNQKIEFERPQTNEKYNFSVIAHRLDSFSLNPANENAKKLLSGIGINSIRF